MSPVGLLGIEPSLRAPEARVLPVYYSPRLKLPYNICRRADGYVGCAPCTIRTYGLTRVKGAL